MKFGLFARHISMRGGIGVYSRGLFKQLIEQNPSDEFYIYYSDDDDLGSYSDYPHVYERLIKSPFKLLWDQWLAPAAALRDGVDAILNTKLSVPIFSRIPSIFVFHGPEMYMAPHAYKRLDLLQGKFLYPRFARAAAATIVSTPDASHKAQEYIRLDPERAHVIAPGREEHFYPASADDIAATLKGLDLPERYLLFVGGLYPIKNFGRLLSAMAILKDRLGEATPPLIAVGFSRWRSDGEIGEIARLGLQDVIRLPGYISDDDLRALYSGCQAFVLPSLYEGFGLAALEALSCGAPVITSDRGGTAEIGRGGAALLVDPFDEVAIADAIQRVLEDDGLRARLSKAGHARAQTYSWGRMAREVRGVLAKVSASVAIVTSLFASADLCAVAMLSPI